MLLLAATTGCKKYVEVPLPVGTIAGSTVFQSDATSAGALSAVYSQLYSQGDFDGWGGLGCVTGLYGDELKNWFNYPNQLALYGDGATSALYTVTNYWTNFYGQLYSVNLAIEGLKTPNSNLNYSNQWLGEAYFLRGLMYFYLTNAYGDVPLVLGSDYLANNQLARSPQANVYKQIVADLKQAQSLLDSKYHNAAGAVTTDRGRPSRSAAMALLARVYLYTQDWTDAESMTDSLIADAADFQMTALSKTFLLNSSEIIWGIEPYNSSGYYNNYQVGDANGYYLPAGVTPTAAYKLATMSDSLVASFEPGDARKSNWVGKDSVSPSAVYYYPAKYKGRGPYTSPVEMIALFRLAEQYLIRAEARAQQNNLTAASADLNTVRARAGLSATTAITQSDLLAAILRERRVELFTEGHRFWDLRRTGNLDAVMNVIAPLKGGSWASYKAWWPIPAADIQSDLHLTQTPGFQ
ncbi:membrane protein [Puia dinghuensis]|uniref:Membrane protein n=1 Tax=Puia dinghuensis TaxID=1792502 RepID=A0A8J2XTC9_9BACT|nr:membrane protein [Puia dinghuensis]